VGYGSTTTNNVVTYVAELDVDNDDLRAAPRHDGHRHHHHRAQRRAAGAQCRAALHAHGQPAAAGKSGGNILSAA
jgi:hypothetical protein